MKTLALIFVTIFILNACVTSNSKYQSYQNLPYPKAMAKEIYPNGVTGYAWGIASGLNVDDARFDALKNCIRISRSKMCVIHMENNLNVLDLEVAQFKTDNPYVPKINNNVANNNKTQKQSIDWGKFAEIVGQDINNRNKANEEARNRPRSTKTCVYDCGIIEGKVSKEEFICPITIVVNGNVCYQD